MDAALAPRRRRRRRAHAHFAPSAIDAPPLWPPRRGEAHPREPRRRRQRGRRSCRGRGCGGRRGRRRYGGRRRRRRRRHHVSMKRRRLSSRRFPPPALSPRDWRDAAAGSRSRGAFSRRRLQSFWSRGKTPLPLERRRGREKFFFFFEKRASLSKALSDHEKNKI